MSHLCSRRMDQPPAVARTKDWRAPPTALSSQIRSVCHDQLLGGATGQIFLGCAFPADDEYRMVIQEAARAVGEVLAKKGVVSRFAIDFLAYRDNGRSSWSISALEINLRMGGTTHPFLALQFLTGGSIDESTGLFRSPSGHVKYYRATDNLRSDAYRGLLPERNVSTRVRHRGLEFREQLEESGPGLAS